MTAEKKIHTPKEILDYIEEKCTGIIPLGVDKDIIQMIEEYASLSPQGQMKWDKNHAVRLKAWIDKMLDKSKLAHIGFPQEGDPARIFLNLIEETYREERERWLSESPSEQSGQMKEALAWIGMVKTWHEKFGVDVGQEPHMIKASRFQMRQNILQEEVTELETAFNEKNFEGVADAICDILYVLLGTTIEFGLHDRLPALFSEVHRSNMSKLDENGKPVKRPDGKILKSNLFSPPNLKDILSAPTTALGSLTGEGGDGWVSHVNKFKELMTLIEKYNSQTGETGCGNHVYNEIRQHLVDTKNY